MKTITDQLESWDILTLGTTFITTKPDKKMLNLLLKFSFAVFGQLSIMLIKNLFISKQQQHTKLDNILCNDRKLIVHVHLHLNTFIIISNLKLCLSVYKTTFVSFEYTRTTRMWKILNKNKNTFKITIEFYLLTGHYTGIFI